MVAGLGIGPIQLIGLRGVGPDARNHANLH